ncbi:hypothetical protein E4T42_03328 [Aureobasidium subglaciale]|nr:hypothetical protein E4T38_02797 [Aureobasidium subglaciale]KAI5227494.1 hypothetical protein E4T40_02379 [Aureobasidium subglaciale]KAI5230900.1 hypothetical protein E4T41_02796 [Aureobasidium subglaciale]KAI5252537.1 hypothetical protein E4T42_03328 [Aureobasidium subglaciale]KAI5265084.1 hypothetical protein E4T46_02574 [Aureobasidium subglaciale]
MIIPCITNFLPSDEVSWSLFRLLFFVISQFAWVTFFHVRQLTIKNWARGCLCGFIGNSLYPRSCITLWDSVLFIESGYWDKGLYPFSEGHSLCRKGLCLAILCLEFLSRLSCRTWAAIARGNVLGGQRVYVDMWAGGSGWSLHSLQRDWSYVMDNLKGRIEQRRQKSSSSRNVSKSMFCWVLMVRPIVVCELWRACCSPERNSVQMVGGGQNATEKGRSFRQGLRLEPCAALAWDEQLVSTEMERVQVAFDSTTTSSSHSNRRRNWKFTICRTRRH